MSAHLTRAVRLVLLLGALGAGLRCRLGATESISLQLDLLQTSTGAAMPTTGLVILVAGSGGSSPGLIEAGSSLANVSGSPSAAESEAVETQGVGLSTSTGTDLIVWAGNLVLNATNGLLETSFTLTLGTYNGLTLAPGETLTAYWFPTLTTSSTSVAVGTSYGDFTATSPAAGSSWIVPADGSSAYELNVFTTNSAYLPTGPDTGTTPANELEAEWTVVPEPADYALWCGGAALAWAVWRRRRGTLPA